MCYRSDWTGVEVYALVHYYSRYSGEGQNFKNTRSSYLIIEEFSNLYFFFFGDLEPYMKAKGKWKRR